ncbi:hypothetical protein T4D_11996 [Trichinella pseudospiralis]|uniref:Uncharacterized protein n=1 Tax=Trichinella pseudospiralis TaxID=6337 RepID=A0A0V1FT01_TRIPS|nr:hypothetical protein T4D_11996 [Trichinella pseudospiralis]
MVNLLLTARDYVNQVSFGLPIYLGTVAVCVKKVIYEVSIDATLCWLKLPLKLLQSSQCGLLLITKNMKLLI